MKGKVCLVMLFMVLNSYVGVAQQSINNYSFIRVPELFEFLKGKDQYQLNSLTKFLFNKYGFNAYFENELPNVRKCDGLYATVEGKSGFIYTRTTVVVKDCNGVELYRSAEGKSKDKDYKKAYHEALREAFDSFERLNIKQKEIDLDALENVSTTKPMTTTTKNTTNRSLLIKSGKNSARMPTAKYSSYKHGAITYLLKKNSNGFTLSQEVSGAEDELLLVGNVTVDNNKVTYTNVMGEEFDAFFDADKNLTVKLPSETRKYILVRN